MAASTKQKTEKYNRTPYWFCKEFKIYASDKSLKSWLIWVAEFGSVLDFLSHVIILQISWLPVPTGPKIGFSDFVKK